MKFCCFLLTIERCHFPVILIFPQLILCVVKNRGALFGIEAWGNDDWKEVFLLPVSLLPGLATILFFSVSFFHCEKLLGFFEGSNEWLPQNCFLPFLSRLWLSVMEWKAFRCFFFLKLPFTHLDSALPPRMLFRKLKEKKQKSRESLCLVIAWLH